MDIAIIPARGGSKRIPRKNIREFCGKPMIAWAIEYAKSANLFTHVIVSTDDQEIAEIARAWGADTPFSRPAELADDHTATAPVIAHALTTLQAININPVNACCIYPCVPLLEIEDLAKAKQLCASSNLGFAYPIAEYAHPIQRAMRRLYNGQMEFLSPQHELSRTQDLERTFHDTGQFYWGKTASWLNGSRMHSAGGGILIPKWRVVDIDDEEDWVRAELLFNSLRSTVR